MARTAETPSPKLCWVIVTGIVTVLGPEAGFEVSPHADSTPGDGDRRRDRTSLRISQARPTHDAHGVTSFTSSWTTGTTFPTNPGGRTSPPPG
jgi:hypothetical protein